MVKNQVLLEFLIPVYCRIESAKRAAASVITQINQLNSCEVSLWLNDDCSPNISSIEYNDKFKAFAGQSFINVTRNNSNLGMSENIFYMMSNSSAKYCTVLTDDDFLEDNCLSEILSTLRFASQNHVLTVFTPRYSYLEDGSLHCIECKPFNEKLALVTPSPLNALNFMRNGFILTGHFFSRLSPKGLWQVSMENGYFPVIHYGESLLAGSSLYVDKPWFHHTVLNETFWHAWGDTQRLQQMRLASDYLNAQFLIYSRVKSIFSSSPIKMAKASLVYLRIEVKYFHHILSSFSLRDSMTIGLSGNLGGFKICCFILLYFLRSVILAIRSKVLIFFN